MKICFLDSGFMIDVYTALFPKNGMNSKNVYCNLKIPCNGCVNLIKLLIQVDQAQD